MKWFINMKIGAKLVVSFIFVAIIAGVVGVIGIVNLKTIDTSYSVSYTNMTVPIVHSANMAKYFQNVRAMTRDMILEDDVAKINTLYESIQEMVANINTYSEKYKESILSDEVQAAYDEFMNARVIYRSNLDKLLQLCLENKDDEAYALIQGDMKIAAENEQKAIDTLVLLKEEGAEQRAEENTKNANFAMIIMIIVVAVGMTIAIVLGILISRLIGVPIRKLSKAAELIADGDLNVKFHVNSKDEVGALGAAFRRMADNLNDVMLNISMASEQVASGSKQVSDSSVALSQGATEQASSVEELTASLEEIAVQTRQNADSANQANQLAEITKENASLGNNQMSDMLKAMDDINDASSNISKIIKVIDEIAFQTNILALNAAVEAARAGQHGKGFAVVAEEVRNLAARSAKAAKETTDMIEGTIKKVDGGTKIANQTADALSKIVDNVAKVANLVEGIAVASNEQALGIEQVNQGIMQVSNVVQNNSATSEESAAASEELSSQAEMLREQVQRFQLRKEESQLSYGKHEKINPEVLLMLEQMSSKAKNMSKEELPSKHTDNKKIVLNDREFGKY